MNILVPLSTQWSPLRTAVVFIAAASEPLPGSVRPQAPSHSPVASFGQVLLLLGVVAEDPDVAGAQAVVGGHGERERAVVAGDLLDGDRDREGVHRRAAVLLGDQDAQHPQLAQLPDHLGRELLVVVPLRGRAA